MIARLAMIAALLAIAPSIAVAQECSEGRERVDGRCCWPGQSWSAERARCEGAPRCPEALVEHGEACLAPAISASPGAARESVPEGDLVAAPVPAVYRASLRAGWPERAGLDVETLARPVSVRGEDEGLIIASLVVYDFGWVLGWVLVFIDEVRGGCGPIGPGARGSCGSWPFAFMPVAGGITAGLTNFSGGRRTEFGWGLGLGPPSVIFQGIGLIMLAIALANETSETGYQPLADEPREAGASLVPSAPGADVGLSLDVRF
jgi:hypothetical protein